MAAGIRGYPNCFSVGGFRSGGGSVTSYRGEKIEHGLLAGDSGSERGERGSRRASRGERWEERGDGRWWRGGISFPFCTTLKFRGLHTIEYWQIYVRYSYASDILISYLKVPQSSTIISHDITVNIFTIARKGGGKRGVMINPTHLPQ